MIGSESLGGALNGWLTNLRAAIPASGSAADQCNPNMISIQDMLLNVFNPCVISNRSRMHPATVLVRSTTADILLGDPLGN